MSQVNVTINGRQFRMACEDGQEDHLDELARELDARIDGLRAKFGEIGDTRLTVMAAITVADELAEAGAAHQAAGGGTRRLAGRQARRVRPQQGHPGRDRGRALSAAAERVESITKKLNQTITAAASHWGELSALSAAYGEKEHAAAGGDWRRRPLRTTLAMRGCPVRQEPILRGLIDLKGAVPDRARGPGHMAPTYIRREPGIDAPTAGAAPHFLSPMCTLFRGITFIAMTAIRSTSVIRRYRYELPQSQGRAPPRGGWRAAMRCRRRCAKRRPRRSRRGSFRSR